MDKSFFFPALGRAFGCSYSSIFIFSVLGSGTSSPSKSPPRSVSSASSRTFSWWSVNHRLHHHVWLLIHQRTWRDSHKERHNCKIRRAVNSFNQAGFCWIFSCEDATLQVLMFVCLSVVNWEFCQFQGYQGLPKVKFHELAYSSMSLEQFHKLAYSSMSFHAVTEAYIHYWFWLGSVWSSEDNNQVIRFQA